MIQYWIQETRKQNKNPLIVYQMGRVGSLSVVKALREQLHYPTFHQHYLFENNIDERVARLKALGIQEGPEYENAKLLNLYLKQCKEVQLITFVRNPITRNLSDYFFNLEERIRISFSIQELLDNFISNFDHNAALNWFEEEFKLYTGIDVYQSEFDRQEKALVIKNSRFQVLLMRSDLEDCKKSLLIADFLKLSVPLFIDKSNSASQLKSGKKYLELYNALFLPEQLFHVYYDSRFAKHFFTDEEKKEWRSTFLKNFAKFPNK